MNKGGELQGRCNLYLDCFGCISSINRCCLEAFNDNGDSVISLEKQGEFFTVLTSRNHFLTHFISFATA